jgi:uncharacterized protein (DUF2141 family)
MQGVRNANGQVKLMLFDKAEGFRKEAHSRQVLALPAKTGALEAVFRDLPAGRYAVIAYHDENGNGKLDLRLGMFPTEGYGLSNNPEVIGPPSFKESSFELPEQKQHIDISLEY